jgi:hypothetical protein
MTTGCSASPCRGWCFTSRARRLDLPRENYLLDHEEKGRREICVVLTDGGDGNEMTIFGTYQQQNMHILYDLARNKLSFVPARCDTV